MVEVHEEDKEYAGGTLFVGSRAELREALARVTLQKVRLGLGLGLGLG